MNDIKLTKEQFQELMDYAFVHYEDMSMPELVKSAKQKGWIVKDEIEKAIEELYEFHTKNHIPEWQFDEQIDKASKVIDLLQKRIKELEGEK